MNQEGHQSIQMTTQEFLNSFNEETKSIYIINDRAIKNQIEFQELAQNSDNEILEVLEIIQMKGG